MKQVKGLKIFTGIRNIENMQKVEELKNYETSKEITKYIGK
jgi:hypothetical protein